MSNKATCYLATQLYTTTKSCPYSSLIFTDIIWMRQFYKKESPNQGYFESYSTFYIPVLENSSFCLFLPRRSHLLTYLHMATRFTEWLTIVERDVTQTSRHLFRHTSDAVKCWRACLCFCVLCCDVQIQWRVGDGPRSSRGHSVQSSAGALLPASPGKSSCSGIFFNFSKQKQKNSWFILEHTYF